MEISNPVQSGEFDIVEIELIEATPETLTGYGELVDDPQEHAVEICVWPRPGWRPIDPGTGNEGGTTEGTFHFWWDEYGVYRGANEAVNDRYVLGFSQPNGEPETSRVGLRTAVYLWHANYHPDGGQLFYPRERCPFVAPLALPGEDVRPEDFKAFYFDGSSGLYIHPNVWHEAMFLVEGQGEFFDKQGKVHARISIDFRQEFKCLLKAPLTL